MLNTRSRAIAWPHKTVQTGSGATCETTVCPIRIDGRKLAAPLGSNALGEHNAAIDEEFGLR